MKNEDFAYTVETKKSFDEAVVSVLKAVDQKGWTVFNVYDIRERLAAKGFTHEPMKIIEVCSGKHANQFLRKNRLVSLCLPCKIVVFADAGKVMIAGMMPMMLAELFPQISKAEAEAVGSEVRGIVDGAK
ncbi:MAG: DUF302 domain-containing protein [Candidatus Micrarchaeota archaeon]